MWREGVRTERREVELEEFKVGVCYEVDVLCCVKGKKVGERVCQTVNLLFVLDLHAGTCRERCRGVELDNGLLCCSREHCC